MEWIQYNIDEGNLTITNGPDTPLISAFNGLTESPENNVKLGGPLLEDTIINADGFNFEILNIGELNLHASNIVIQSSTNLELDIAGSNGINNQLLKSDGTYTAWQNLGTGLADYVTKWSVTNLEIGQSLLRDNGDTVSLGAAPFSPSLFYVAGSKSETGRFQQSSSSASAIGIRGISFNAAGNLKYGGYFEAHGSTVGGSEIGIIGLSGTGSTTGSGISGLVGVAGFAKNTNSIVTDCYGGQFVANQDNISNNYGIRIVAANAGAGLKYAGIISDGNEVANKVIKCIDANGRFKWDSVLEEEVFGIATYSATDTGTVNLDISTFSDSYRILDGNTDYTFSNTPTTGKTIVKNLIVSSPTSETLSFPVGYTIIGTYDITGVENYITIKFSNYPTVGLKATVFITQA